MLIAVAVSGGMDSLLAMVLLKEQGFEVMGVHGHFLPQKNTTTSEELTARCAELSIPFHALDVRVKFQARVADEFVRAYAAGLTPNPCAMCNPAMKFGVLFDEASSLGATHFATGHYARLLDHPDLGRIIIRGTDPTKDQSYFLSLVSKNILEQVVFPLGELHKRDVLAQLNKRGLTVPLPTESQEICFVPDDDYQKYLENSGQELPGEGAMVLADGTRVGQHHGLWRYTQGQRRGLGVAWAEPLYVLDKDVQLNRLVVGTRSELAASGCVAGQLNFFADFDAWPQQVLAQVRYRQQATAAKVSLDKGKMVIEFSKPCSLPAPGQVAAIYTQHGALLAGGIIESSF